MTTTVLGTTDERDSCDCCGKTGLKSTVALDIDGDVVFFGVVCAARKTARPAKEIRAAAKHADDAKVAAAREATEKAHRAAYAADQAILDAKLPHLRGDRFRQIEALGGYQAFRALVRLGD